jgi:molecular chaperone GrpE (heat shock protein)
MRQAEARRTEAALQDAERATAEALMEVHDALSRATRQAERLITSVATALRQWSVRLHQDQERLIAAQQGPVPAALAVPLPAAPQGVLAWLRGRFGRALQRVTLPTAELATEATRPETVAVLHQCSSEAGHMADRLAGLAAGYRLSLERLERLLATYGVAPIVCLGQPVDAELMEVVQVVVDPSQPSGVVCDEVRRGYRRHGQVYRFAQVVATRATLPATCGERREEE